MPKWVDVVREQIEAHQKAIRSLETTRPLYDAVASAVDPHRGLQDITVRLAPGMVVVTLVAQPDAPILPTVEAIDRDMVKALVKAKLRDDRPAARNYRHYYATQLDLTWSLAGGEGAHVSLFVTLPEHGTPDIHVHRKLETSTCTVVECIPK